MKTIPCLPPHRVFFPAVLVVLLLARGGAQTLERVEMPDGHVLPHVTTPPRIDANLDDWDPAQVFTIELDPERQTPEQHFVSVDSPIRSAADVSARILLAWDATHLYVGARVRDDHLRGIAPGTAHHEGPDGWAADGLMVQLHSYRQPLQRPGPHTALALRYTVEEGGRGEPAVFRAHPDERWKLTPGSRLASRETEDGYLLEAAIPWAELGFRAAQGEPLFLSLMLVDVDPDQSLKQLGWHWGQPQKFRLVADPAAVGLLSVSHERFAPGREPQAVRVQLDAPSGDVRLESLHLEGPDGFEATHVFAVDVPQGQRVEGIVLLENIPSTPGSATLRLEAVADGRRITAAEARFDIVSHAQELPRVANPIGEIVRPPPERVVHHAQAEQRRGRIRYNVFEDRSGYERWILEHVRDNVDRLEHTLDAMMGPEGSRWASNNLLGALALHRLTGESRYAEWVRMLVESQLRFLETATDSEARLHRMSALFWPRHFLWQTDPDTALAPADAEARYAALWVGLAADPPDWLFQESGYHNRTWRRWRDGRLMIHFADALGKPVDPRIRDYVAWHDEHLVPTADTTDNSSGYNWHGLQYFISTHLVMGNLDAIRDHDVFWQVAARLRDYYSPAGILPNWGDTSGWSTGMAHFDDLEVLAWLSGDGRFRHVAHRIAEYYYNFMWDDPTQYHMVRDSVAQSFARAWLIADDSVKPRAPSGASHILTKARTVPLTTAEMQARPGLRFGRLGETVPDKAVLQSGGHPFGMWAFVELLDHGGHAGDLPGNLAAVFDQTSALYAGQGYWDTRQSDNNVVWIEDLDGTAADALPMRTDVPVFVEDRALTWLRVRTVRYAGLPITAIRDIFFVKDGFIVVRDELEFHATMRLRVGPAWHTRHLGPQCGDDWFNTYYTTLYHTGLGVGRGVHAFPNPPRDLLIAFAPRPDYGVRVDDRYDENPWRVSPVRLRQFWTGFTRSGDRRTFLTVLMPHPPAFDVRPFREKLEILVDDGERLLLRAPRFQDARNPLEGNHVTLQFNPGGELLEDGDWRSDARLALVERSRDGRVRQAAQLDGRQLVADGEDLFGTARALEAQSIFRLDLTERVKE